MKSSSSTELSSLLKLSIPLVAVNVGNMLMGLVDTAIAGRVDAMTQAACGLGNTIIGIGAVGGMGLIMGIDPIASQALGAGRPRTARRALWTGIYLGLFTIVPVVLATLALGFSLEWIGVKPELASQARTYLHHRLIQFAPWFVLVAVRAYLQAAHATRPMIASMIVANVVNAAVAWILTFGAGPVPALGLVGLAWATNVASVLQLAILAAGVRLVDAGPGDEPLRRLDPAMLAKALKVGVPLGLQLIAEVGIFSLAGLLIARMGVVEMAANQIALTMASLTFMVPLGVSMATSVRVGHAIGRGDTPGARRAGLLGIGLGAGFMLFAGMTLWLFPGAIVNAMTKDASVAALAVGLLQIAAAFQLFDGTQSVGCGALRGAGATGWSFGANVVGYWALGLPIGLILAYRSGMGLFGLWWGLTLGLAIVAVLVTLKFLALSSRPIEAIQETSTEAA